MPFGVKADRGSFSLCGMWLYWPQMRVKRVWRFRVSIADMGIRRIAAQKNYDRGFFRFVLARAAAFGTALFLLNVLMMTRSGGITAPKLETAAVICAVGGILLGIGLWLHLLRLLHKKPY
jgi:hypothetical protein